jgi:hypothetical protein
MPGGAPFWFERTNFSDLNEGLKRPAAHIRGEPIFADDSGKRKQKMFNPSL